MSPLNAIFLALGIGLLTGIADALIRPLAVRLTKWSIYFAPLDVHSNLVATLSGAVPFTILALAFTGLGAAPFLFVNIVLIVANIVGFAVIGGWLFDTALRGKSPFAKIMHLIAQALSYPKHEDQLYFHRACRLAATISFTAVVSGVALVVLFNTAGPLTSASIITNVASFMAFAFGYAYAFTMSIGFTSGGMISK